MRTIPLTQDQVALVSNGQFEEINRWKWQAQWNKNTNSFYATRKQSGSTVYMHRQIMKTPKGMVCDHINHNTLDNQDSNLRNVTPSQSVMNTRMRPNNKLGERCIHPAQSGFRVDIKSEGKRVFRKKFRTLELAIAARDEKLKEVQGEFAYRGES